MDTDVIETAVPLAVTGGEAVDLTTGDQQEQAPEEVLTAEDLIEEISIDGMCGVY
jgi:mycofactocin precursor